MSQPPVAILPHDNVEKQIHNSLQASRLTMLIHVCINRPTVVFAVEADQVVKGAVAYHLD